MVKNNGLRSFPIRDEDMIQLLSDPEIIAQYPQSVLGNLEVVIDFPFSAQELPRKKPETLSFAEARKLTYQQAKKAVQKVDSVLCQNFGFSKSGNLIFDNSDTICDCLGPLDTLTLKKEFSLDANYVIFEVAVKVPASLYEHDEGREFGARLEACLPYHVTFFEPLGQEQVTVLANHHPWIYTTNRIDAREADPAIAGPTIATQYLSTISAYLKVLPELKGMDCSRMRQSAREMLLACHTILNPPA
jgi:hypothetical protein